MNLSLSNKRVLGLGLALLTALVLAAPAVPLRAASPQQSAAPLSKSFWQGVVQLGPMAIVKNARGREELKYFGWGSGTVLSPDGVILTNQHVTDYTVLKQELGQDPNIKLLEGLLAVFFTVEPDEPPVPMYIAQVVGVNEALDLAVLRIVAEISGKEVNPRRLDLPFIALGDSDKVNIEDELRIYGYPGIGGSTITFTKGSVSGFDSEGNIRRAWIKTDATIAGGNSGGAALNVDGELVGVPTQAAVTTARGAADCRRVQDTNGDGRVDERDTCIPIGGFINALRPVNLALPLLEEALGEDVGGSAPSERGGTQPERRGQEGGRRAKRSGVRIAGEIVDAVTGRPIPNAIFVTLKPGVTWNDFDGSEEQILDVARTDRRGRFQTGVALERGEIYSFGWTADRYEAVVEDDVEIPEDAPDVIEVKLELRRKR
ncbi:MAG: serine protease [Anaerolineae bacterium]|nr:serine protease [Thermoflexales bacterium]MDW8396754.1 serine protease [Anaerolineae bacterium]